MAMFSMTAQKEITRSHLQRELDALASQVYFRTYEGGEAQGDTVRLKIFALSTPDAGVLKLVVKLEARGLPLGLLEGWRFGLTWRHQTKVNYTVAVTDPEGWGEFPEPIPSEAECWLEVRTETLRDILDAICELGPVISMAAVSEMSKSEMSKLLSDLLSSPATKPPSPQISGRYWTLSGMNHPEGWLTLEVEPLTTESRDLLVEFRVQHCRFQPTLVYRGEARLLQFSRLPASMLEPLFPQEPSEEQIAAGFEEEALAAKSGVVQTDPTELGAPGFFEINPSDQRVQFAKVARHPEGIQISLTATFPEGQSAGTKIVVRCGGRERTEPLEFDAGLNAWTAEVVMQIPFRVACRARIALQLSTEN